MSIRQNTQKYKVTIADADGKKEDHEGRQEVVLAQFQVGEVTD